MFWELTKYHSLARGPYNKLPSYLIRRTSLFFNEQPALARLSQWWLEALLCSLSALLPNFKATCCLLCTLVIH